MKVNVDVTVEVSDETRKKIAALLGQKTVDRQGIKDFLWLHGSTWENFLEDPIHGDPYPVVDELSLDDALAELDDEDLI